MTSNLSTYDLDRDKGENDTLVIIDLRFDCRCCPAILDSPRHLMPLDIMLSINHVFSS